MSPAEHAQLALLVEAGATPTPGCVDRQRDHDDLRLEHLLAGAVGAGAGLEAAAAGEPVGEAFERAVAGMADAQSAGNTQFGALLLLVPLVRASATDELSPAGARAVVEATTVADAVAFARAFEHVDVAVGDPPAALADVDVRAPESAARAVEERGLTLADLLAASATVDGIAREWTAGFERTFGAADGLAARAGPLSRRAAGTFLELLAAAPDPHVAKRHGEAVAADVRERAASLDGDPDALADALVAQGVNPGTTADLLAGGLFVALERGASV